MVINEASGNVQKVGNKGDIARFVKSFMLKRVFDYICGPTTRWLTGVYNKKSDGSIVSAFVYTHDKIGNRKTMTLANGDIVTYGQDAIYQLTSEVRTGTTAYNIAFTYDEVGNRLTQTKNGQLTTSNYNDANQLLDSTTAGLVTSYAYDNNGNQVTKADGTNTWTWVYDYENRQVSYDDPLPTNDAQYAYDAGGTRIAKTVNGITEKYLHDGANVICDYDGSNTFKASYVTPFLDQNLIMVRGGNTYYYTQDGLGSVRELLDANQVIKNQYDYYAFGEALNWIETVENRYTYTGREWDGESQTYFYRARQYNPVIGRFIIRDSIEYLGGLNLYSYVSNSPVVKIDPSGLQEKCCCGVESFIVKWTQINEDGGKNAAFRIDVEITFKKDNGFDPACCEYKQMVKRKHRIKLASGQDSGPQQRSWSDDGYSRSNDHDGDKSLSDPHFTTGDLPGWSDLGTIKNQIDPSDEIVYYEFTAEQTVYASGSDTCEANPSVVSSGRHTVTMKGKYPRVFTGVPYTFNYPADELKKQERMKEIEQQERQQEQKHAPTD